MSASFEWSRKVEFYETDMAGIVHFSNFYRWMEAAEHAFLSERAVALHDGEIGWPRVNAQVDFKRPVKFGDLVRVAVKIGEVRSRSVKYLFEIRINDDDVSCAVGEMTSVCVRLKTMEAVEISEEIHAKLSR